MFVHDGKKTHKIEFEPAPSTLTPQEAIAALNRVITDLKGVQNPRIWILSSIDALRQVRETLELANDNIQRALDV